MLLDKDFSVIAREFHFDFFSNMFFIALLIGLSFGFY